MAGAKGYDIATSLDDTLSFLKQPATCRHTPLAGTSQDVLLVNMQDWPVTPFLNTR